jgi:hypothetical protein
LIGHVRVVAAPSPSTPSVEPEVGGISVRVRSGSDGSLLGQVLDVLAARSGAWSPGVDIHFGVEPIVLRWGVDRLCGLVAERNGPRPRSGAIFAFVGRSRHTGGRASSDASSRAALGGDSR